MTSVFIFIFIFIFIFSFVFVLVLGVHVLLLFQFSGQTQFIVFLCETFLSCFIFNLQFWAKPTNWIPYAVIERYMGLYGVLQLNIMLFNTI